jgi:hypothetical protein
VNLPFAYENDLCAVLESRLDRLLEQPSRVHYARTLRERPVGQVIPDFLYIRAEQAVDSGQCRGLSSLEAAIVATLLPGKPLRLRAIAQQLYCRTERVAARLRVLEKRGVLESADDGAFCLRPELSWWSVHVTAVEAKLRRWREALQQAVSYLAFADQAYVALPAAVVEGNNDLVAAAEIARVGIIAVYEKDLTLTLEAPCQVAHSADRVWLLSRTVGIYDGPAPSQTRPVPRRTSGTRLTTRVDDLSTYVG